MAERAYVEEQVQSFFNRHLFGERDSQKRSVSEEANLARESSTASTLNLSNDNEVCDMSGQCYDRNRGSAAKEGGDTATAFTPAAHL